MKLRYHRLYRSDAPCQMSDAEWEQVLDMGVRTVIDLRSLSEQQNMPYEVPEQITRISVPSMQEEIRRNNEVSMQESAQKLVSALKVKRGRFIKRC